MGIPQSLDDAYCDMPMLLEPDHLDGGEVPDLTEEAQDEYWEQRLRQNRETAERARRDCVDGFIGSLDWNHPTISMFYDLGQCMVVVDRDFSKKRIARLGSTPTFCAQPLHSKLTGLTEGENIERGWPLRAPLGRSSRIPPPGRVHVPVQTVMTWDRDSESPSPCSHLSLCSLVSFAPLVSMTGSHGLLNEDPPVWTESAKTVARARMAAEELALLEEESRRILGLVAETTGWYGKIVGSVVGDIPPVADPANDSDDDVPDLEEAPYSALELRPRGRGPPLAGQRLTNVPAVVHAAGCSACGTEEPQLCRQSDNTLAPRDDLQKGERYHNMDYLFLRSLARTERETEGEDTVHSLEPAA
ncbi:hypothetical protein C8R47DRAFT_1074517 [Mycena vitilis]|nr:hypothetical protein C8R47DRAFT_1074517 [Mycena vitilis]